MFVRRMLVGGVFFALTFLFVYGNAVFFSNTVPESHCLGWAAAQGTRVLNMPGEWLRQKMLTEDDVWNQSYNGKSRWWLLVGAALFFTAGCLAGLLFHLVGPRLPIFRRPPAAEPSAADDVRGPPSGRCSGLALGSLLTALMGGCAFGHILGYGAVLLGWWALADLKTQPASRGRKTAWAGILIGAAVLILWTILLQIQPPLHAFEN